MLDQSVLDWMDELGDQADEVIGMMFAGAQVTLALQLVKQEAQTKGSGHGEA